MNRRQFLHLLSVASVSLPQLLFAKQPSQFYDIPKTGHVRLLHITDCHAQLLPLYYREPHINLGVGVMRNKVPHLVEHKLLTHFNIPPNTRQAHAFTPLDFTEAAQKYGKVGGFAHLATLINQLRDSFGWEKTLLLDGGDTWQGTGIAYWTRGQSMVEACNLLGVDVMTGHWEFTYSADEVLANLKQFKGEFVAQNIFVKEEALFMDAPVADEAGHAFKPYTLRDLGGVKVAVIGQAFPYTPIANPARFMPDWTFGIREAEMQSLVNKLREQEKPAVVVVLSHNGMDVDRKMAQNVSGIDVILGGHTHDGVPQPLEIKNAGGTTLVCNAGSNGKFVGVLDLKITQNQLKQYQYHLLPVFSNLLQPNSTLQTYIEKTRAPFTKTLTEKLATTEQLLYRRGNFNGTFDQLIGDALKSHYDAQISLSPGFRWGTTVLPDEVITFEDVLNQTCITYPETYTREMTGQAIKNILEDVADNLFNQDPYLQQGGDMVRVNGLNYTCDPTQKIGERISELTLDNGQILNKRKKYKVAGWATVNAPAEGKPIWDIVANYLREQQIIKSIVPNTPKLLNVKNNFGITTNLNK
jgi:sulfur-oxidizing protein SoxB